MANRGWKRPFDDPIPLLRGRFLVTLEDRRVRARGAGMASGHGGIDPGGDVGRTDDVRQDRRDAGLEPQSRSGVQSLAEGAALGPAQAREGPMTVFVYVNTAKQVGDADHVKVFANVDAAEKWFEENDPEGVAFEYEVLE